MDVPLGWFPLQKTPAQPETPGIPEVPDGPGAAEVLSIVKNIENK
jgi:hypothetical protein